MVTVAMTTTMTAMMATTIFFDAVSPKGGQP